MSKYPEVNTSMSSDKITIRHPRKTEITRALWCPIRTQNQHVEIKFMIFDPRSQSKYYHSYVLNIKPRKNAVERIVVSRPEKVNLGSMKIEDQHKFPVT